MADEEGGGVFRSRHSQRGGQCCFITLVEKIEFPLPICLRDVYCLPPLTSHAWLCLDGRGPISVDIVSRYVQGFGYRAQ